MGRLQELRSRAAAQCALDEGVIEDVLPCTPFQEAVMTNGSTRPGTYVARFSLELPSTIKLDAFINAWKRVFESNSILRTRIISIDSEHVQVIINEPFDVETVTDTPLAISQRQINTEVEFGYGHRLTSFSLRDKNGSDQRQFLWTLHHALYDGHSIRQILDDVAKVYHGLELEERPRFDSFTRFLDNADQRDVQTYWQSQFAGLETEQLPHVRQENRSPSANEIAFQQCYLGDHRMSNARMQAYLRAAWAIVLSQWTSCADVVFGGVISGRTKAVIDIRRLAAPTLAVVPIRIVVSADKPLSVFVDEVYKQAQEMRVYEHVGLKDIANMSSDGQAACRFQTVLTVQPYDSLRIPHEPFGTWEKLNDLTQFTSHAISLEAVLGQDNLTIRAAYDSKAVDSWKMKKMLEQYVFLIEKLLATEPERTLASLSTLPTSDVDQIKDWNAVLPATENDVLVHELIEEMAISQPDAIAVQAFDGNITYGQLNEFATRLARRLVSSGVQTGVIVPLFFEKSVWVPVSVLAVMKAGGASTLLDMDLPVERLQTILGQLVTTTVMSSSANKELASRLTGSSVIVVNHSTLTSMPTISRRLIRPNASTTLYVVSTSGTMGKPKGVMISHTNFATAVKHQQRTLGFDSTSHRVLDFASYSFDVSWSNLLHTLTSGACLCIPSPDERRDDLIGYIRRLEISYVHLTPSVCRVLDFSNISSVQVLHLSGEPLQLTDLRTVTSSAAQIDLSSKLSPSIGRALGTRLWVVDVVHPVKLVPIGCIGELWIEGPLVGRYLDAEKTAHAFFEDPPWLCEVIDSEATRGRLYRTGDLVYHNEDGTLMFVGRKDRQVKIRGMRLELSDVEENVRSELPEGDVEQVVAAIGAVGGSDKDSLIAFVVVPFASTLTTEELAERTKAATSDTNERLSHKVPSHMIPSTYVPIVNIPTTATGKTDYRRLRELANAFEPDTDTEAYIVLPSNWTEEVLLAVWARVLNIPTKSISVDMSFYRLGGDSISAIQVVAQCRSRSLSITVAQILQLQTISNIAKEAEDSVRSNADVMEYEPAEEYSKWSLSPIQQMFLDAQHTEDGRNHFNQSFLLVVKRTVLGEDVKEATGAVVRKHAMLRARFVPSNDGQWRQHIVPMASDVYAFAEHDVDDVTEIETCANHQQAALDITNGPVFAVDVFSVAKTQQLVLLSAHHLVVDLISWRVIWHDLQEVLDGKQIPPPTSISFASWCKVLDQSSQKLVPANTLPVAPEPANWEYWGIEDDQNEAGNYYTIKHTLESEDTRLLLGPSNSVYRSEPVEIILAVLISTFQTLFSDRNVPPVYLESHGREMIDGLEANIAETVGWFTTILPIQMDPTFSSTMPIIETVRRVKDIRRRAPDKGLFYMASRYYTLAGREQLGERQGIEILLNYTGLFQQLESDESLFARPTGRAAQVQIRQTAPDSQRFGLIELNIGVANGRMSIACNINNQMNQQSRLQEWTKIFTAALGDTARELSSITPPRFTLTDLAVPRLSYAGLDSLASHLESIGVSGERVNDVHPATPLQEGIILSRNAGSASYANHWVWTCQDSAHQSVSLGRLKQAWTSTIDIHAIFSTIFVENPDTAGVLQVEFRNVRPNIRIVQGDVAVDPVQFLDEMEPPNFKAHEPEYLVTLCQTEGKTYARLDMCHALIDAASIPVLLRDVANAYDGIDVQSATPRRAQFREVVGYAERISRSVSLPYWKTYLSGMVPCCLPLDYINDRTSAEPHSRLTVHVPKGINIYDFCKSKGITRSTFLQVAWALVLSANVTEGDVCFGNLASGRDVPVDGAFSIVGPLVNMLVSRIDLSRDIQSAMSLANTDSIAHLSHQYVSLADVQHHLELDGGQNLFNTAVTIRDAHKPKTATADGLEFNEITAGDPHEFPLVLSARLDGVEIEISIIYQSLQISPATAWELESTLEKAISFIIASCTSLSEKYLSQEPAKQAFFKYQVGTSERTANMYWKTQFQGVQASQYPASPSPSHRSHTNEALNFEYEDIRLPSDHLQESALVLAAWSILQAYYTDAEEVLFGVATFPSGLSNLTEQHFARLPFRRTVNRDTSVGEFLFTMRDQAAEISTYQNMGLQRIRRLGKDSDHACQFQTLILRRFPSKNSDSWSIPDALKIYALIVEIGGKGDHTRVRVSFDSSILEPSEIIRLSSQFEHALRQLLKPEHTQLPLAKVGWISENELQDIFMRNAGIPLASDTCVHDVIAKAARKRPDSPAVHAWDGILTFAELEEMATRLSHYITAHYLNDQSSKSETIVAVCFEKSMWTPVAMLAVLKAGFAATTLDMTLPQARLQSAISQLQTPLLLTSPNSFDISRGIKLGAELLIVDRMLFDSIPPSIGSLQGSCDVDRTMCIFFTSGSSGQPKGIKISHKGFSSSIGHQSARFGITSKTRVFDFASYNFDISWFNFVHALANGACLCIPSEDDRRNDLSGSMERLQASFAFVTPSVARVLKPEEVPTLRMLALGGEPQRISDFARWPSHVETLSVYGPAEGTVVTSAIDGHKLAKDYSIGPGLGFNMWLVDPSQDEHLVPVGAIGELWIEGPLVGKGYLNDPEKTAGAFIDTPTWLVNDGKHLAEDRGPFYRTGDLMRYRPHGLEFVGRKDGMVKIRGQRIELGEIEHHLGRLLHDRTDEQVKAESIAPKDSNAVVLAAFIVPRGASAMPPTELASAVQQMTSGEDIEGRLGELLPSYMVPNVFIPLATTPMTATGKTDRRELRRIGADYGTITTTTNESDVIGPSNATEKTIRQVWAEVLNIQESSISINAPFLRELGGDSITAMRAVAQCRKRNIITTVADILRMQTVREVALRSKLVSPTDLTPAALEHSGDEEQTAWPLSPIQKMFFRAHPNGQNHYNQSFMLRLKRSFSYETLRRAILTVQRQHQMLRARFRKTNGEWKQYIEAADNVPLDFVQHDVDNIQRSVSIAHDRQQHLNIESGPVFSVDLFNFDDANASQLLLFSAHHLVVDLVSWRQIWQDLQEFLHGRAPAQPAVSFVKWCETQQRETQQLDSHEVLPFEMTEPNLQYWGVDSSFTAVNRYKRITTTLDTAATSLLLGESNAVFRTDVLDILAAVFIWTFQSMFPERGAPALFLEGHGREPIDNQPDLNILETVGWFTTMYPLQLPTEGTEDIQDMVRTAKDIRRRIPGKGRPYFAQRYYNDGSGSLSGPRGNVEVLLNYAGLFQQFESSDSLFEFVDKDVVQIQQMSLDSKKFALIEMNVGVVAGKMEIRFDLSQEIRHLDRLTNLAKDFPIQLEQAAHTLSDAPPRATFSDFPLLSTSYRSLDRLIDERLGRIDLDNIQDIYKCTPMQEGILISKSMGTATYANLWIWTCAYADDENALISIDRLEMAWKRTISRHNIFQHAFVEDPDDGGFLQVLLSNQDSHVHRVACEQSDPVETLQALPAPEFATLRPEYMVTLCQGTNGHVGCRLDISHSLIDAGSIPVLLKDISAFYDGHDLPMAPQFDRAVEYISQARRPELLAYWKEYLKDLTPCIFPSESLRNQDSDPGFIAVENVNARRIHEMCMHRGVTRSTFLQVAWALVLSRYTGIVEQSCFGYLASGRDLPIDSIEEMVAPLINMLICRVDLKTGLEETLIKTSQDNIEHLSHQHTPLAEIRHELQLGGKQLFNTAITIRESHEMDRHNNSLHFRRVSGRDPHEFDLCLAAELAGPDMKMSLTFKQNTISKTTASLVRDTLLHVLEYMIWTLRTGEPPINGGIRRDYDLHCIWGWNSYVPPKEQTCVHDLIKKMVQQQPSATAILAHDGNLSYAELDDLSTAVACHLIGSGVTPGQTVALCTEKSLWTPVAILATLKAGAAFCPIDRRMPISRKRDLIDQTETTLAISTNDDTSVREGLCQTTMILPDQLYGLSEHQQKLPDSSIDRTAYIIFTSGSSGRAKGVVLEQYAVSTSLLAHGTKMGFDTTTRMLQFASLAFDASIAEILTTLVFGGVVCIPSEEDKYSNLTGFIEEYKVNTTFLTPSVLELLSPEEVPSLKTLICGGEAVTTKISDRWATRLNLINGYGPTETIVFSVSCPLTPGNHQNPLPIGRALCGSTWIVHEEDDKTLVPIGTTGELLIEGPALAAGYLNDTEKTNAAFIEDPQWLLLGHYGQSRRHGRLYKTGDLVRYRPDGQLEYVGRKDNQVKIRGQRVELAEVSNYVEQALEHTMKAAQVVAEVIKPQDASEPTLVAFVVPDDPAPDQIIQSPEVLATEALSERMAEVAPPHMIPTAIIPVESIPVTMTGTKTDRRRLREIGSALTLEELAIYQASSTKARMNTKPLTENERELQGLWASTLGVAPESIGKDYSFLQIGDSVSAMRLVGAARKQGLSLTVGDVLRCPKLEDMATLVQREVDHVQLIRPFSLLKEDLTDLDRQKIAKQCGVHALNIEDVLPCTPLQVGLLALTSRRPGDYILHRCFELQRDIDLERFQQAWGDVVAATPILRTRFVDVPRQGLVQVVIKEQASWRSHANFFNQQMDVNLGSMLTRVACYEDEILGKAFFLWTIHHALYDGWSMSLIMDFAESIYHSRESPPLPQIQPFVRHILLSQQQAASNDFWKQQFVGSEMDQFPILPSPTYQPQADSVFEHTIDQLPELGNEFTLSTVIRAAWSILVACHMNSYEALYGAVISGRQAPVPEIERIAAPTIATVPLRIVLKREMTVEQLLQQVHQQAVDMIPHEQFGLQNIRQLSTEAELSCRFQSLLVVQTAVDEQVSNSVVAGVQSVDERGHGKLSAFNTYALMLLCEPEEDSALRLRFSFDSSVLGRAQIARMAGQLKHLLQKLCDISNTTAYLRDLILSPSEWNDILEWNASVPVAEERCVHDLIIKVAERQLTSAAVHAWDGDLTYGQLNEISRQWASYLVDAGLGSRSICPLFFEKSVWMPVAKLAVMRAGAASVALDTVNQPEGRLQTILDKICPAVVLSSPRNAELAQRLAGTAKVIIIDENSTSHLAAMQSGRAMVQLPIVHPSSSLYIVFTSGTSGEPKGSTITHRNFSSAIRHQQYALGFRANSRVYDFVSYAFDVTWSNILHTLTAGGCLCIPSDEDRMQDIEGSIRSLKANYAHFTPTVGRLLNPSMLPDLDVVQFSGEALNLSDLMDWQSVPKILNTYGPSECSVTNTVASLHSISHGEDPSIGKAIGCVAWVLNTTFIDSLAPIGSIGELVIEGPLVGQGYIGDPEKTAQAFVQNPAWLQEWFGRSGRLYRTGDLVRYKMDGSIQYIGRKDGQVKIRGQRVELADVEHHLRLLLRDGGVESPQAVAEIAVPQDSEQATLVAFVSGSETSSNEAIQKERVATMTPDLEGRLGSVLPSYMIPAAYIALERVPTTPTGKTDRRHLREMVSKMSLEELLGLNGQRRLTRRPPSTAAEQHLSRLWASTLKINSNDVGVDDTFLRLGGDSIQAMRLASLARNDGVQLSVSDILSSPRLADLALKMTEAKEGNDQTLAFSMIHSSLDEARSYAASQCQVRTQDIQDMFPCTPLQEGLLAITARRAGDYIAKLEFELPSWTNLESFEAAWCKTVQSVDILRTRIVDVPNQGLVQVVLDSPGQLESLTQQEQRLWIENSPQMGLSTPLHRAGLGRQSKSGTHLFILVIHHALYDASSILMLLEVVDVAYQGGRILLTPFQDFVKHVVNVDSDETDVFWKNQFAGLEATQFPALPSPGYHVQANRLTERQINGIAWLKDHTAGTVIRGVWAMLQAAYTVADEAAFGAVVSGRQVSVNGVERMIGPAIATVPVRADVQWERTTVEELLSRLQAQAVAMIPYEQAGIQRIRRVSEEAKDCCGFQTLLVVQPVRKNYDKSGSELFGNPVTRGIRSSSDDYGAFNTYPLLVLCQLEEEGLQLRISYDSGVVTDVQAERMAAQFEHLLRQVCGEGNATTSLRDLSLISERDLRDVKAWNSHLLEDPEGDDQCVHDLIAETTLRQNDSPAVWSTSAQLTYGELDDLSTRLAFKLASLGISPKVDVIVPLCFEKSIWTVVALLGVMKAGGASVLLDTTLPHERLCATVSQVSPTVILSSVESHALATSLQESSQAHSVLVVDETVKQLKKPTMESQILPGTRPVNSLYVVFTSGSTGASLIIRMTGIVVMLTTFQVPKGVIITHRNFVNAVKLQQPHLGFREGSRVLDFASHAFDASWYNILHTLTTGGTLCIPSEFERKNDLTGAILHSKADFANLTPTVAQTLGEEAIVSLTTLELAGEAIDRGLADRLSQLTKLRVAYGPSECTIFATGSVYERQHNGIGRGIGQRTWLVDALCGNRLAAVGAVAELWLEGPLVGWGYLNDPQKTADAFFESPSWLPTDIVQVKDDFNAIRAYRTGDLVQYKDDGSLTFIGRKDNQVKIRGMRVELQEVEQHILKQAGEELKVVADIVSLDKEKTKLVAFVAPMMANNATDDEWEKKIAAVMEPAHDRLAGVLPSQLVPSAYIPVLRIPTTATGKLDRRRLREIATSRNLEFSKSSRPQLHPPNTNEERQLQQLWATLLGIEPSQISANDSFLEVGGDSITAMRLVGAARRNGLLLTVSEILERPRLRDMAVNLRAFPDVRAPELEPFSMLATEERDDHLDEIAGKLDIQREAILDAYPVSFAQKEFLQGSVAGAPVGVNYLVIDLPTSLDRARFNAACAQWVTYFDILRTVFVSVSGNLLQAVLDKLDLQIDKREIPHSEDIAAATDRICLEDSIHDQPLGASFLKFFMLRDSNDRLRFVARISHAQYDGVSLEVLVRGLGDIYNGVIPAAEPPFAKYIHHIVSQNAKSYRHWRTVLKDSTMTTLSRKSSSPAEPDQCDWINVKMRAPLPSTDNPSQITPASLFTAACAMMLKKVTGSTDVLFGRIVSGRAGLPANVENVAGPCINTIPVRVRFGQGKEENTAVRQVCEQYTRGIPHESVGFDELREECASWAPSVTDFGFTTVYQNIDQTPAFGIGGEIIATELKQGKIPVPRSDTIRIGATPSGDGLQISASTKSTVCSKETLRWLLEELCVELSDL